MAGAEWLPGHFHFGGDMAHSGTIIYMRNVPKKGKLRALLAPLPCENFDGSPGLIPTGYIWDGSSSGLLAPFFPRHNHPIASCRHDYRCLHAKTPEERAWADREFKKDVGKTSWWITKQMGFLGVRAGAFLGIGCNYNNKGVTKQ